jgi:hypothetical protein
MKYTRVFAIAAAAAFCLSSLPAWADDDCPSAVKTSVEKAFPGATVKKCEIETKDGKQMYEVKLKTREGATTKMDLDPAGLVLLTQQSVAVEGVPTVVMKTYKSKYADYKIVKTEKWTYPDGKVTYRFTYAPKEGARKAVVYTNEGVLVEESEVVVDEDMD